MNEWMVDLTNYLAMVIRDILDMLCCCQFGVEIGGGYAKDFGA